MLPDIPWFVYAMLLAPVGLIVFAAIYKYLEVRAASDWPSTPGKVVVSKPEVRQVKVIDSDREAGHRDSGCLTRLTHHPANLVSHIGDLQRIVLTDIRDTHAATEIEFFGDKTKLHAQLGQKRYGT